MNARVQQAVSRVGDRLKQGSIQQHIAPLFSRVLSSNSSYLANHSLGRPLDAMADDIAEATAVWYSKLGDAWDAWLEERQAFRTRIAALIGANQIDCVIPKTSAGQGLRAVLNALPGKPRVISTRGEFDSIDVILKQYATLQRIELRWIEPNADGDFSVEPLIEAVQDGDGTELVVVSQVMFMTGQIVKNLDSLAKACHQRGARLLVDSYHAVGVIPVDVVQLGADFVIGGSYKYLRGGPGACFLYISLKYLRLACAHSTPAGSLIPTLSDMTGRSRQCSAMAAILFSSPPTRAYLVPGPQRPGIHAGYGRYEASRLQPQAARCPAWLLESCRRRHGEGRR